MMVQNRMLLLLLGVSSACAMIASAHPPQSGQAKDKANAQTQAARATPQVDEAAEGEKRFQTNCGRCHQPPQDLSPREARAVLRQMRVRANLTAEDERLILKYIAP